MTNIDKAMKYLRGRDKIYASRAFVLEATLIFSFANDKDNSQQEYTFHSLRDVGYTSKEITDMAERVARRK